jgi:hypothetical protein
MLLGIAFVVTGAITPAQVYQHARIPVLIPTVMPTWVTGRVYENVDLAKPGKYRISFGLARNCNGSTACDLGTVTGGIQVDMADLLRDPSRQSVRLRDSTPATFVEARCGASCGDSALGFWRRRVWYMLYLHAGSKADMVRAANSMLSQ